MAVLELKTAEPGAQSRLIITGTNCGGTAEAERNVRPQPFYFKTYTVNFLLSIVAKNISFYSSLAA